MLGIGDSSSNKVHPNSLPLGSQSWLASLASTSPDNQLGDFLVPLMYLIFNL